MDTKYHIISSNLYKIVDVNIAYLKEKDYNEIRKTKKNSLERSVYFMQTNEKDVLDELYEGDDVMEKVLGELYEYDGSLDSYIIYDREQYKKDVERESREIALEEAIEEAREWAREEARKIVREEAREIVREEDRKEGRKEGREEDVRQEK